MLELYILPPLFELPSLSGSCIAALSLCHLSLSKSDFKIIESTDLSIGLPALKDEETWIRGYTNIKIYLSKLNDVDSSLSAPQQADCVAWGSLIEDLGETLTWNSLFVSRQNYLEATRPGVANTLSFPHGFMLPTRLRAYAVRRCAEIGMIEDLDEDQEKPTIKDGFSDTWLTRRRTWDEKARTLRLRALASDFYAPLTNLLASTTKDRPFIFGESPTSLDALVYGHLILHLLPTMPDPVLRTTLVEAHPRLAFYLHKCHEHFEAKNHSIIQQKDTDGFMRTFQGWGVEKGKRVEDLAGIGGLIGSILVYALYHAIRK